jgi:adenylyltransferase/sulfurtransferase
MNKEQLTRYSRHIILPEIGMEGQEKLLSAKVLIIGAGGLGSPIAFYLAAAGVGTLGLVDFDNVDLSNLQRQILHTNDSIGTPKLDSAEKRIKAMNPDVKVLKFNTKITSENALDLIRDFDLVIDGTDNFPTRYLVNDACVMLGKPNIYGSIFRFEGQCTVFYPKKGPCYRCLYPEPPPPGMVPSCAEGGVLGILPGLIGTMQATEAVKLIVEKGETLIGRLVVYDALKMKFRELKLHRDTTCPVCGDNPTVTKLIDYEEFCGLREEVSPQEMAERMGVGFLDVEQLAQKLNQKERFFLLDVREAQEYAMANIEGAELIPLGELESRVAELEPYRHQEIVVHCARGGRSLMACLFLKQAGFSNVSNLEGGIYAWMSRK